ncbi:MAG: rod shape-determining protein MreC [Elusimicrobiaceae bacterium]|nr:rod shape-determining protein MreC [Elusimicrobiaceae bacterium]
MSTPKHPISFKTYTGHYRRRYLLPVGFLLVSFLLMVLPLDGFVASVKAVVAYIFIPQVRAAHSSVQYAQGVSQTVQELLQTHQENESLKQEIQNARLSATQAQEVFAENERLSALLKLQSQQPWQGVWAKVAYREPSQWNSIILDKGSAQGIKERSAVIAVEDGQVALAGVVVEVNENTAKVLLVRDEEFSAAVRLEQDKSEGLLVGGGSRAVQMKYLPLLTQIEKGERVYTSKSSSVFPAGILVGQVNRVGPSTTFQTSLTVEVSPQVRSEAVQEVFVILDK